MGTILKNIVQFVDGGPTSLPHRLNVSGLTVIPQFIAASVGGFAISADATHITISPTGNVNIYVERWHSIEDVEPPEGLTFPFVVGTAGGSSGGGSPVQIPLINGSGFNILFAGAAVYTNGDGTFGLARANDITTSTVIGLTNAPVALGAKVMVTLLGPLELTIEQWNGIISGTTGLTPGARYWLDPNNQGQLVPVSAVPTDPGHVVEWVATALSTTILNINPSQTPVLL